MQMDALNQKKKRYYRKHRNKNSNHMVGKMLAGVEFLISVIFYAFLLDLGVVGGKAMLALGIVMLLLSGLCLGLQYIKKGHIPGIILSVLFSILFLAGSYYVQQTDDAMGKVGGATYKTDNMVVAVRKDDKAENLSDIKGYQIGVQLKIDKNNTDLMMDKVSKRLREELKVTEFDSVEEMMQGLLDGKVDAVIYNEAFNGILEESIENLESKIRVIYHYGIDTELEIEEKSVKEPFHIYISGIDVYGPITKNSRSDVNIIMTVNLESKQILLTTTPRDYYVPIPGVSGGQKDKLTHAGIYGVDKSMETLESIYGIDISYYARVNFTSLIKIVDILGGVDVYSKYAFTSMHGKYKFQEGMNHMNGEQALGFSRERYSFQEGDNQRGKNQEAVIQAIIEKVMSPEILKNASKLIESASDSVETNMSKDEMAEIIRMQLEDGGVWKVYSVNALGSGGKQPCYSSGNQRLYVMYPNMDSVAEIKTKMDQVMNGQSVQ